MGNYDLIVIGGGPAGYLGAIRAAQAGKKVALFEERALGGVCLNEGCIPSKALLNSSKMLDHAKNGKRYGVLATDVRIDQGAVIARKNKVVKQLTAGIGMSMKALKVEVIEGSAKISPKDENLFVVSANSKEYKAVNLLIATGSKPILPPIQGLKEALDSGFALTNREILDLEEIPENLAVIGGGIIGLEMASYYNSVGSNVTVIEMLDKIAGPTEEEVSDILFKNLKRQRISFEMSSKVTAIGEKSVSFEKDGHEKEIICDKVLLSVGRSPNIDNLGLENIAVHTEKGAIITDEKMQTNIPGVYAAGDVNGKSMLAHTAYRESEVAINNICKKADTMDYSAVSSVIYTNPEVAGVGETLKSALEKGYEAKSFSVSMRMSGRYMAETDGGNGIAKLIVDMKTNRLLGVHLIGTYTSEIIYGAALMLETKISIENIKKLIFPHPTVGEAIREALFEIN
ncbi:MAG: dihydrolipoyl dehydrogenase [Clostridiales bacterium]|nr:dihydrolipoyl dehydrogenase [Clostridiales bacterium]